MIKIKEAKNEQRKEAKNYSSRESLDKIRNRIEGIFGSIKQALGSYEQTTKEKLAILYAISKFTI